MANIQIKFLLLGLFILAFQTTKGVRGQCATPPINQAVYEGDENTILMCNRQTAVSYVIKPASDSLRTDTITNYDDVVAPAYMNLYDVNQTGLIIKTAQGNATIPPISTAGLYVINPNNVTKTGAKLIVVRGPPVCSCSAINSTKLNVSCSLVYADSVYQPTNAIMTWTANGNAIKTNDIPLRILNNGYYTSTSVITVNASGPSTYTCNASFGRPSVQLPYVANNTPAFSASCDVTACPMPTTANPLATTINDFQPGTTTTSSTQDSTVASCDCAQTTVCPSPEASCTEIIECRSGGTNLTDVYDECVVKAELYARCDNCCRENLVCGIVVTLRNDSRWLIHDPLCNDNKCEMAVFDASCMSTDWKLLTEKKVIISGVGDYVQAGNGVQIGLNGTDCSESCKRMMTLP